MKNQNKNKGLSKKEQKAVVEFKDKLLNKFKDRIILITMFGSKVRGEAKQGSDIDILVVYKGNGKLKNAFSDIEWDILKKYNYDVYLSLIPYTYQEYKYDCKIQTPFIYNIEREGVTLWDTIPRKKH